MTAATAIEMPSAIHCDISVSPSHARFMYPAARSEMNRRSPRVVSNPKMPRRGVSGQRIAIQVKANRIAAMVQKNNAVGKIHAIQPPGLSDWVQEMSWSSSETRCEEKQCEHDDTKDGGGGNDEYPLPSRQAIAVGEAGKFRHHTLPRAKPLAM